MKNEIIIGNAGRGISQKPIAINNFDINYIPSNVRIQISHDSQYIIMHYPVFHSDIEDAGENVLKHYSIPISDFKLNCINVGISYWIQRTEDTLDIYECSNHCPEGIGMTRLALIPTLGELDIKDKSFVVIDPEQELEELSSVFSLTKTFPMGIAYRNKTCYTQNCYEVRNMENNEILQAILHEIKGMNQRMDSMDQRFDTMDKRFDTMDQRMDVMQSNIQTITTDLTSVKADVASVKDDVTSVKADTVRIYALEKKVDVLTEGMQGVTERFAKQDKMEAKLDELLIDTHALRETVSGHTVQLKAIK